MHLTMINASCASKSQEPANESRRSPAHSRTDSSNSSVPASERKDGDLAAGESKRSSPSSRLGRLKSSKSALAQAVSDPPESPLARVASPASRTRAAGMRQQLMRGRLPPPTSTLRGGSPSDVLARPSSAAEGKRIAGNAGSRPASSSLHSRNSSSSTASSPRSALLKQGKKGSKKRSKKKKGSRKHGKRKAHSKRGPLAINVPVTPKSQATSKLVAATPLNRKVPVVVISLTPSNQSRRLTTPSVSSASDAPPSPAESALVQTPVRLFQLNCVSPLRHQSEQSVIEAVTRRKVVVRIPHIGQRVFRLDGGALVAVVRWPDSVSVRFAWWQAS